MLFSKQNLMLAGILVAVYYLYKMNKPAASNGGGAEMAA
jgi:hypothetical protein